MYAITKITVMCNGERTERVEGIYLTGHKAKRAMKKLYRFLLAEGHRPEPFFDEDNSIITLITLPSSAEELEKEKVSYWAWRIIWLNYIR